MGKGTYFFVQIIWQILYSTLFWFVYLYNASMNAAGNGDSTMSTIITFGGPGLYLLLTIIYIVFGAKKVARWKGFLAIVVVLLAVGMVVAGFYAASFASPYLGEWFGMEITTSAQPNIFSVFGV